VGIRKGAWRRAWRYPAYLWSLRWVYAVKKTRRLVYAVYPRIPPNTPLIAGQVICVAFILFLLHSVHCLLLILLCVVNNFSAFTQFQLAVLCIASVQTLHLCCESIISRTPGMLTANVGPTTVRQSAVLTKTGFPRVLQSTEKSWKWKKEFQASRSLEIGCWSWKNPDFWSVWSWTINLVSTLVALHLLVSHTNL